MSRLSKAIQLLEELIAEVERLPTFQDGVVSESSSASGHPGGGDAAWDPRVPPGHTAYSWGLENDSSLAADVSWAPSVPQGHTAFSWKSATGNAAAGSAATGIAVKPETLEPQQQGASEQSTNQAKKEKQQPKSQQGNKPQSKPQKAKQAAPPENEVPLFYRLDIRVGKIVKAWKHSNADSMFIELIDIGGEEPRQVCSGVYGKIPQDKFEGSMVLCIVNLKPSDLRGTMSYGMVLAASTADKSVVELVLPPSNAPLGVRVYLDGDEDSKLEDWMADAEINAKGKKNVWALMHDKLVVDADGIVRYDGRALRTLDGLITSPTLRNVKVG
eukprot:gb/GEZN01011474.1/.p1 GENE.gb/GEZN01011474.1/~~gb/GEZN01011474.1/.p1  ORF type:complete len:329 (+),score=41.67 gb/GEZN01011474.1/:25-1011(+)